MTADIEELRKKLISLDKKSYRALKSTQGVYKTDADFLLHLDYVQGDPFAAPSRLRLQIPLYQTSLHQEQFDSSHREKAFKHFFTKEFESVRQKEHVSIKGTGKSGMIMIDTPGPEVIERASIAITEKFMEFRISCGLPAKGRQIAGKDAARLLCDIIPAIAAKTVKNHSSEMLKEALLLADDQQLIRTRLREEGKLAFVANGSILPRQSGASHQPLSSSEAVPFRSPAEWERTFTLTDGRTITGMLIDAGITLIVGGGYHGKSTLLQALERGVYDHEKGDGREFVIMEETSVKIRAEDRRSVNNVNISSFINQLPGGKSTSQFSSEDASGSTSQAANIVEAIEAGAESILIDEDTSATNFMIRDARMQQLVSKDKEPITPFVDRVTDLYTQQGISTVLVLGGSGDYFEAADRVIMMDEYQPYNKTLEAKELTKSMSTLRTKEPAETFTGNRRRKFPFAAVSKKFDKKAKIQSRNLTAIQIGKHTLDLQAVEQLVSPSQTEAVAMIIKKLHSKQSELSIPEMIEELYKQIRVQGIDVISPFQDQHPGNIALPRKHEVIAAINRIRR